MRKGEGGRAVLRPGLGAWSPGQMRVEAEWNRKAGATQQTTWWLELGFSGRRGTARLFWQEPGAGPAGPLV